MWLRSLEISGFGHFRDFRIDDFSDGLTVLYGPNEAGKTTLTRFVNYALWGLRRGEARRFKPLRGGDLGGLLVFETHGKQQLQVERRGRKLSAMLGPGRVESDADLERVLDLDRGLFAAVFSFALDDLASLSGLGTEEARERLFSGALLGAGMSVAEAQKQLGEQRDVLWRPRAACEIRRLEDAISELRSRLSEGRRLARGVRGLHEDLRRIELERDRCEGDARRFLGEAARWAALQASYPVFVDMELAKKALAELSDSSLRVDLVAGRVLQERLQDLAQARAAEVSRLETARQRVDEARCVAEGVKPDVELLGKSREVLEVAAETKRLGRLFLENLRGQRDSAERRLARRLQDLGVGVDALPRWTTGEVDGLKWAASQAAQAVAAREKVVAAERGVLAADERIKAAVVAQEALVAGESAKENIGKVKVGWAVVGSLWIVSAALLVLGGVLVYGAESGGIVAVGGVLIVLAVVLVVVVFLGLSVNKPDENREQNAALGQAQAEVAMAQAARAEAGRNLAELELVAAGFSDAVWLQAVASTVMLGSVRADSFDAVLGVWRTACEMADELEAYEAELAAALDRTMRLQGRGNALVVEEEGGTWRAFYDRMEALESRLNDELKKAEQLEVAEAALAAAGENLASIQGALDVVEAELEAVLGEAGAEDIGGFRQALQVEASRAEYLAKFQEAERGLRTILGGFWNEETLNELAEAELAHWEVQESESEAQAASLQAAGRVAGEAFGEKTAELQALERSTGIAQLEFELAQHESRLDAARESYAELSLAGYLLEEAMRTFREAHQPNVLRLASADLAAATDGRYTGLRASEDGKGLEILGAAGQVLTEDALSRGTTELLYIILRLALVCDYAQRGIRMPMVMDDILVNLDPERAENVAALLMRMSREQQIIMLSCRPETLELFPDSHVVELQRGAYV